MAAPHMGQFYALKGSKIRRMSWRATFFAVLMAFLSGLWIKQAALLTLNVQVGMSIPPVPAFKARQGRGGHGLCLLLPCGGHMLWQGDKVLNSLPRSRHRFIPDWFVPKGPKVIRGYFLSCRLSNQGAQTGQGDGPPPREDGKGSDLRCSFGAGRRFLVPPRYRLRIWGQCARGRDHRRGLKSGPLSQVVSDFGPTIPLRPGRQT